MIGFLRSMVVPNCGYAYDREPGYFLTRSLGGELWIRLAVGRDDSFMLSIRQWTEIWPVRRFLFVGSDGTRSAFEYSCLLVMQNPFFWRWIISCDPHHS